MYYTKNAKDPHPELMEGALGCVSKQTATIQKETFQSIIKDSFSSNEKEADEIFMNVQENLNTMIDEHNSMYDDIDCEPIVLTKKDIQNILIDSGISEEITNKIEKSYIESFGSEPPLAENLIDTKVLAKNEQKKKEEKLVKQVEMLQEKLLHTIQDSSESTKNALSEENEVEIDTETNLEIANTLDEPLDANGELELNETSQNYDIILQVKPQKVSQIKSQVIDGKKYLVIPIDENDQTKVNGINTPI